MTGRDDSAVAAIKSCHLVSYCVENMVRPIVNVYMEFLLRYSRGPIKSLQAFINLNNATVRMDAVANGRMMRQ